MNFKERNTTIEPRVTIGELKVGEPFIYKRTGGITEVIYLPIDINSLHFKSTIAPNTVPCVNIASGQIRLFNEDIKVFRAIDIVVNYTKTL